MERLLEEALGSGEQGVVVDRPNMEQRQRLRWLTISRSKGLSSRMARMIGWVVYRVRGE